MCERIGAFKVEGAGEVQWAARAVQMGSADACWRARVARAAWARANTFCGSGARALAGVLSEEFGLNMQNFQVYIYHGQVMIGVYFSETSPEVGERT